jgi:hypothetical protein
MKKQQNNSVIRWLLIAVLFLVVLFATYFYVAQSDKISSVSSASVGMSSLTINQIKNAEYVLSDGSTVKLINGSYVNSDGSKGISIHLATPSFSQIDLGDIDGNGTGDAVAVMDEYCGAAGSCGNDLAAWINVNGSPQFAGAINIGYRQIVNWIMINADHSISLDLLPNNPNGLTGEVGYLNQEEIVTYKLAGDNKLVKVSTATRAEYNGHQ